MDAGIQQQDPLVQDLISRVLSEHEVVLSEIHLAELVCYSQTHIRQEYYAAVGESLGNFIQRIRLERAAGLLTLGDLPT